MAHRSFQRLGPVMAVMALILFTPTLGGCGSNNIPTYEQSAKAAWSEVLNQYKRRADLIPNLVEAVKGFADQEKSVLTGVIEARAKATQAQINIPSDILTKSGGDEAFSRCSEQPRRRLAPTARGFRAVPGRQIG